MSSSRQVRLKVLQERAPPEPGRLPKSTTMPVKRSGGGGDIPSVSIPPRLQQLLHKKTPPQFPSGKGGHVDGDGSGSGSGSSRPQKLHPALKRQLTCAPKYYADYEVQQLRGVPESGEYMQKHRQSREENEDRYADEDHWGSQQFVRSNSTYSSNSFSLSSKLKPALKKAGSFVTQESPFEGQQGQRSDEWDFMQGRKAGANGSAAARLAGVAHRPAPEIHRRGPSMPQDEYEGDHGEFYKDEWQAGYAHRQEPDFAPHPRRHHYPDSEASGEPGDEYDFDAEAVEAVSHVKRSTSAGQRWHSFDAASPHNVPDQESVWSEHEDRGLYGVMGYERDRGRRFSDPPSEPSFDFHQAEAMRGSSKFPQCVSEIPNGVLDMPLSPPPPPSFSSLPRRNAIGSLSSTLHMGRQDFHGRSSSSIPDEAQAALYPSMRPPRIDVHGRPLSPPLSPMATGPAPIPLRKAMTESGRSHTFTGPVNRSANESLWGSPSGLDSKILSHRGYSGPPSPQSPRLSLGQESTALSPRPLVPSGRPRRTPPASPRLPSSHLPPTHFSPPPPPLRGDTRSPSREHQPPAGLVDRNSYAGENLMQEGPGAPVSQGHRRAASQQLQPGAEQNPFGVLNLWRQASLPQDIDGPALIGGEPDEAARAGEFSAQQEESRSEADRGGGGGPPATPKPLQLSEEQDSDQEVLSPSSVVVHEEANDTWLYGARSEEGGDYTGPVDEDLFSQMSAPAGAPIFSPGRDRWHYPTPHQSEEEYEGFGEPLQHRGYGRNRLPVYAEERAAGEREGGGAEEEEDRDGGHSYRFQNSAQSSASMRSILEVEATMDSPSVQDQDRQPASSSRADQGESGVHYYANAGIRRINTSPPTRGGEKVAVHQRTLSIGSHANLTSSTPSPWEDDFAKQLSMVIREHEELARRSFGEGDGGPSSEPPEPEAHGDKVDADDEAGASREATREAFGKGEERQQSGSGAPKGAQEPGLRLSAKTGMGAGPSLVSGSGPGEPYGDGGSVLRHGSFRKGSSHRTSDSSAQAAQSSESGSGSENSDKARQGHARHVSDTNFLLAGRNRIESDNLPSETGASSNLAHRRAASQEVLGAGESVLPPMAKTFSDTKSSQEGDYLQEAEAEGEEAVPRLPPPNVAQVVECLWCYSVLAVPANLAPTKSGYQKLRCGKCLQVSKYAVAAKEEVAGQGWTEEQAPCPKTSPTELQPNLDFMRQRAEAEGPLGPGRQQFRAGEPAEAGRVNEPTSRQSQQKQMLPNDSVEEEGSKQIKAWRGDVEADFPDGVRSAPGEGFAVGEMPNPRAVRGRSRSIVSFSDELPDFSNDMISPREVILWQDELGTPAVPSYQKSPARVSAAGLQTEGARKQKQGSQSEAMQVATSGRAKDTKMGWEGVSKGSEARPKKGGLPGYARDVRVNGLLVHDKKVEEAEKLAGPIQSGVYWYDQRAGFWGAMGGSCLGIIPAGIPEFTAPLAEDCAKGNTRVWVNGRQLHKRDLQVLMQRGLIGDTGASYLMDHNGDVADERTGKVLQSLGKLQPSLEKKRRGSGMHMPKGSQR